jgi:hypothetical protein
MEQKIKYTTDGKKVVVLGNLNSQEKIVQEIFVVDGSEIPSGEHFVVKSLHDVPVLSWKEKQIREIEELYEKTYEQKIQEYKKMQSDFSFKIRVIKEKLSFLRQLQTKISEDKLTQLIDFISGDVKFIVVERYGDLEISEYDSSIATKEYGRFESIRLLSLFGKTDGNLNYKMNQYYDGSGSWFDITPCKTMDEALIVLENKFKFAIEKGLTDTLLKVAEKYNLNIPNDKMDEYKVKKRKTILENIERQKQQLENLNQELSNY